MTIRTKPSTPKYRDGWERIFASTGETIQFTPPLKKQSLRVLYKGKDVTEKLLNIENQPLSTNNPKRRV